MEAVIKIIFNKLGAETKLEIHILIKDATQTTTIPQSEARGGEGRV